MLRKVKKPVLDQIRFNEPLLFKIALATNRKFRTIEVWARDNHSMLTAPAVLDIIKKELGLSEKQILEEVKDCAPA